MTVNTDKLFLEAESRNQSGKGAARALRRAGRIPAVMYGTNTEPTSLSLPGNELSTFYKRGKLRSKLFELSLDGKSMKVLPQAIQTHPVTDQIEHVDFLKVDENTEVKVHVPVIFEGRERCIGIRRGGTLNIVRHEIGLLCKASNIPSSIKADIRDLSIGDSLHVNHVTLPEGTKPLLDWNFTIATIAGRMAKVEESDAAATTSEEGAAEGDAAEKKEG